MTLLHFVAAVLPLGPTAPQEAPPAPSMVTPAPELGRFEPLLGRWRSQGSGRAETSRGTLEFDWTGEHEFRSALGGHVVQELTRLEVEGLGTLLFKNLWGYDRSREQHVVSGITNMGDAFCATVEWPADDTFFYAVTERDEGNLSGERWVTRIGADRIEQEVWKWVGAGKEVKHVWGTLERARDDSEPVLFDTSLSAGWTAPEMAKLAGMAGRYTFEGDITPMPGMTMQARGREAIESIFGGAVLEIRVEGEPLPGMPAYEAWGAYAWNAVRGDYDLLFVDNFGTAQHRRAQWVGQQLVATSNGQKLGQPSAYRSVVSFGEGGTLREVVEHELIGTAEPLQSFRVKYEAAE